MFATSDPAQILGADRVIFPGVGHAAAAMERLRATRLDALIPTFRMPVMGICLGMQLMCAHTEEGGTEGLGIFTSKVLAFKDVPRVPHIGWNDIFELQTPLFDGVAEHGKMYFAHSYYVPANDYTAAVCDYGGVFSAAMRRDNFYSCQFHPEKSAAAGRRIIENFLTI